MRRPVHSGSVIGLCADERVFRPPAGPRRWSERPGLPRRPDRATSGTGRSLPRRTAPPSFPCLYSLSRHPSVHGCRGARPGRHPRAPRRVAVGARPTVADPSLGSGSSPARRLRFPGEGFRPPPAANPASPQRRSSSAHKDLSIYRMPTLDSLRSRNLSSQMRRPSWSALRAEVANRASAAFGTHKDRY